MALFRFVCPGCGVEVKVETFEDSHSALWKKVPCPDCHKTLFEIPQDMTYKIAEYYKKADKNRE